MYYQLAWYGDYYMKNEAEIKQLIKLLDKRAGLSWIENGIVDAMKGSICDFVRLIWLFWIIWKIMLHYNNDVVIVELHSRTAGVNPTDRPTCFEAHIDTNSETQISVSDTDTNESIRLAH